MTREEAIDYLVPINEAFKKLGFNRQLTIAIDALTSSPWHKISEELPKDEAFLVRKIDNPQVYAILIYSHKENGFWNTMTGGFNTIDGVREYYTHWMPIPKLKEEGR